MTLLFHKVVIHEKQMCQFRGPKRKLIMPLIFIFVTGRINSQQGLESSPEF